MNTGRFSFLDAVLLAGAWALAIYAGWPSMKILAICLSGWCGGALLELAGTKSMSVIGGPCSRIVRFGRCYRHCGCVNPSGAKTVFLMTTETRKNHPWIKAALANAKESLKPSPEMNYRIVIPALVLSMVVGAFLHTWLGERYRFQAVGNGTMLKTDRWTGEAWKLHSSNGIWQPIQEPNSVTHKFTRRKDGKLMTVEFERQPSQADLDEVQARIDSGQ